MFQFPGFPSPDYVFIRGYPVFKLDRFPDSEISGSKVVCTSPKLIAAYHVLRRLWMPRHSPCALTSLTKKLFWPIHSSVKNVSTLLYAIVKELNPSGLRSADRADLRAPCSASRKAGGLVGVPGIEPGTSSLSGTRSNQLSYTPGESTPPLSSQRA